MRIEWTPEQLNYIRENIGSPCYLIHYKYSQAFNDGRSYDSIQKKVQQIKDGELLQCPALIDGLIMNDTNDIEELPPINLPPMFSIDPIEKANLKAERKFFLEDMIKFTKNNVHSEIISEPVISNDSTLVVQLSDLHIGQQSDVYNLEIAKKRLQELPKKLFDAHYNHLDSIDEVVVLLIGDIVEGDDIFPTQPWHVTCSTMEQVEVATKSLWNLVYTIRNAFQVPVRLVCAPGNHGRSTKNSAESTNWDNVVYHCLRLLTEAHPDYKITIKCKYQDFNKFRVKDKIGVICHQSVKHLGTPAMIQKVAGWVHTKQCDFIASGHYHHWQISNWNQAVWLANGSLCGPNDLAERMAAGGPARQGYFLVTPGMPLHGFGFIEWQNESEENEEECEISSNEEE